MEESTDEIAIHPVLWIANLFPNTLFHGFLGSMSHSCDDFAKILLNQKPRAHVHCDILVKIFKSPTSVMWKAFVKAHKRDR